MRRGDYIARKIGGVIATVFVAITLNFLLFRVVPGDAVTNLARVPNAGPGLREALERQFGLDQSKWDQYWAYLRELFQGNLGVSFANQQAVTTNLGRDLLNTVPMVLFATVIAIAAGIVTGVVAAWRRGTVDHATVGSALAFYAVPSQWLGLLLIAVFAGTLPSGGMTDDFLIDPSFWERTVDIGKHMILPATVLGLGLYGQYTLIVRAAMRDALSEDYVLAARAKGLSNRYIVIKHALPNAMLPTVTLVALSLGYVVAGAILVETVFSWPGIGRAVYDSVLARDYPMLQGIFLVLTISVIVWNFVADLAYLKLDPRIVAR